MIGNHHALANFAAAALLAVAYGGAAEATAAGPPPAPSYTAAQAEQGATAFENDCAQCHGANLEGYSGPALTGAAFANAYGSLSALLGFISQNMPFDSPGSLSHDDYVAIVAFILSRNGAAPGATPLTFQAAMASKTPIWKSGQ
ncbi:MAG: c-type cytochrome [Acetobacteraceae bacterium]